MKLFSPALTLLTPPPATDDEVSLAGAPLTLASHRWRRETLSDSGMTSASVISPLGLEILALCDLLNLSADRIPGR